MKVLGCFKIVPDLDMVLDEDWKADERLLVDTGYVKPLWNCFDESALEMMLKLSDLSESFDVVMELNALTVGKAKHESFLKTLYALGYKNAVRVEEEGEIPFCPERIAETIGNYVKEIEDQDVIVLGSQSSEGNNGKTPFLLAEYLGWPCISQVTEIEPVDDRHLKVRSQIDGADLIQTVRTPFVLAIGNASSSYLRVPTLKDKMGLGKQPIHYYEPDTGHLDESVELIGLKPVSYTREAVVIEGETPQEKAEILYNSYLKGRLEKL